MPTATSDGVDIYYETAGEGLADDTPVVLVPDAGYGAWLWGWQHAALAGPHEVVTYDARGTGNSDASEPYDVATLAADLEAVLADLGTRNAHLVGVGLGGMVALQYALDFSRARTLSLLGTSPGGPQATSTAPEIREQLAADPEDRESLRTSLEPVASDELLETEELVEQIVGWRAAEDASREVQQAHFAAMDDFDVSDRLYEITIPALVGHGTADRVLPVENGRLLAEQLPRGELQLFEGEHFCFVERSKAVNDALVGFLEAERDD
ncbi:alpha/beta fold hydrolase [Halorussus halophilus]|uniref:alpha/beta fold hydrolase n=1 Tax=Halorussus halophilus TaxID=2650975 RepID=UPI001300DB3D|nr:alpha/beta hydrolase [Halorussus halophilus]